MQKSWKICQLCQFFQLFSHLLFPQHLGTHFFGFLTIFYMIIGRFYWIFIMKIACIKTNMSKKRSKRATTLAEVKKSIFFKKRPKSDLVFTWYSLFEVSRVTWWWKWWRFLTFDPTAILAYCVPCWSSTWHVMLARGWRPGLEVLLLLMLGRGGESVNGGRGGSASGWRVAAGFAALATRAASGFCWGPEARPWA